MPNTNFQTIHQMGSAINSFVKQATGRYNMRNIDMEHITVAQNHYCEDVDISGRVVSFNAGAAGITLDKCLVQIEPVQEGTGDPSPDNVRPISGWTGAKVTVSPTTDEADGQTYDITFPSEVGTVYGDSLTIAEDGSGVLRVDRASVDLGGLAYWSKDPNRPGVFYTSASAGTRKPKGFCACSEYKWRNDSVPSPGNLSSADNTISLYPSYGSGYIFVVDIAKAELTGEQFLNAMSGVQLVYELAEPITYTLTAAQITTLLGQNNVWADTGDIEVKFKNIKEFF